MATQTLEALKKNLNFRISRINEEESLRNIEKAVEIAEYRPIKKQSEMLKKLAKPMRKKLDLEELKREQNWKRSSQKEIDEILENFDWQISDEEFAQLLKDI